MMMLYMGRFGTCIGTIVPLHRVMEHWRWWHYSKKKNRSSSWIAHTCARRWTHPPITHVCHIPKPAPHRYLSRGFRHRCRFYVFKKGKVQKPYILFLLAADANLFSNSFVFFFCATSLSSINRSQGEDSMDWKLNGARVYYCIMMRVCRNRPSEAAQVPRSDQPTSAKGKYLPLNSVLLLVLCALLFLFLLFWVFFCFILIRSFCIVSTANHRHVTLYPFLYVQVLYASFFGHVVSIVIVGWIWLCWRSKIKETSTTTMNEWTMSDTRSIGRQNIGKKIKRSQ